MKHHRPNQQALSECRPHSATARLNIANRSPESQPANQPTQRTSEDSPFPTARPARAAGWSVIPAGGEAS